MASCVSTSVFGMHALHTLNDIFFEVVDRNDRVVMMHRQAIQWVSVSSIEFYQRVVGVARGLRAGGIRKGIGLPFSARTGWSGRLRILLVCCRGRWLSLSMRL